MLLLGSCRRWRNRKGKRNAFLVYLTSITRHLWSIWGVNLHVFHKFFFYFFRMCLISLKGTFPKDFALFLSWQVMAATTEFKVGDNIYRFYGWKKDKQFSKQLLAVELLRLLFCFNYILQQVPSCQEGEKKFCRAESWAVVTVFAKTNTGKYFTDQKSIVE